MTRKPIDYALASSKVAYNPETGDLIWKDTRQRGMNGKIAGHKGKKYVEIRIGETLILGHRLAWLLHYGEYPPKGLVIDHINRNGFDNRISNLRCVPQALNCVNRLGKKYRGVCFCKQTRKWKATASIGNKQVWLGRFATREAALAARIAAEKQIYPGIEIPRGAVA